IDPRVEAGIELGEHVDLAGDHDAHQLFISRGCIGVRTLTHFVTHWFRQLQYRIYFKSTTDSSIFLRKLRSFQFSDLLATKVTIIASFAARVLAGRARRGMRRPSCV